MAQGKNKENIRTALSIATSTLLGIAIPTESNAQQKSVIDDWEIESAFLFYSEAARVSAIEGIISANKTFDNDEVLNLKFTIDALTGASANGAVAQPYAQTFTRPSGQGQYVISAKETPLDDTFKDTRVQLNGQWTQTIAQDYTLSSGAHLSKEYDYLSLGVNSNLAVDFDRKNTTLSAGFSYFYDTFTPEGGIPVAFASMLIGDSSHPDWDEAFAKTRLTSSDTKTTTDLMFGLTQVINRRMLVQMNYSYSVVDGYLTDPFKIISVINDQGISQDYIYEKRPSTRVKQSTFLQSMYHFEHNILDLSYRYMWDDWDITSHTIDSRLRIPVHLFSTKESYIQPHIRFYKQTAAQFYQPYLLEQQQNLNVDYASADYRIGQMVTLTLGVKYGVFLAKGNELSFRLEYYQQSPENAGFESVGVLNDLNIYPAVKAIIAQVSYSF